MGSKMEGLSMKRKTTGVLGRFQLITPTLLLGATVACLGGCDRAEIHSYHVAREFDGATVGQMGTLGQASQADHIEMSWTIPDSWTQIQATSEMRIATFQISNGLEVAVTAFPGDVGGLAANVNRWRGQIGLEPIDAQRVDDVIYRVPGTNVIVVDEQGEESRLIGTIIDPGDGKTWFAKIVGPTEIVGDVKDDLIKFSSSFVKHNHATQADSSDHAEHEGHEDHADKANSNTELKPTKIDWDQPSEWGVEENASSILLAAFNTESGARITLASLLGDGGGLLSNINRWRGQLGLPIAESLGEMQIEDLGEGGILVDIQSADQTGRMVVAVIPAGKYTLFFKLTGSVESVHGELQRFEAFIEAFRKIGTPE